MSTISKALRMLGFFSSSRPEIGLTEFSRLSGYDKASTYRRLTDLLNAGFLEQDADTKTYRLGAAIPRLALVREQTVPAQASAKRALRHLYDAVGETVHVSIPQGIDGLSTLAHIDDERHGNRVYIEPADVLPYHATASGLVVLAYSDDDFRNAVLGAGLPQFTDETAQDPDLLRLLLEDITRTGYGRSEGGYEAGVHSYSAPLFDRSGRCAGSVAVALPKSRVNPELEALIFDNLSNAAREITQAWGGEVPDVVSQAWATSQ